MTVVEGRTAMVVECFFDNREALLGNLVKVCSDALKDGVARRGSASFMASGGSSPEPLYQALSSTDLPWDQVTVALVDERWVAVDHEKSNEAFVGRSLLQGRAQQASFVGMKTSADTAQLGLNEIEGKYQAISRPFDLLVLGMGDDGHTASLFPHAQGLQQGLDKNSDSLCAAITAKESPVTGEYTERMTLTLAALLEARHIVLLITGEKKLAVFREALKPGPVEDMPVRAILHQGKVPVVVYWAP